MTDDLIRRQEAIDAFYSRPNIDWTTIDVVKKLNALPAVDAVPVIRCKDCKYMTEHYDTDGNVPYWTCSEWDSGTDYDGFCPNGERRTDE